MSVLHIVGGQGYTPINRSIMARTGRPPSAFDLDNSLDNIDIDDMFADGEDGLFDDLEMDLAPIGDITGNMESIADVGAVEEAAPSPAPSPAAEEPPKRRKTKRKPKSPVLLDEDEDLNEVPKKRRKVTKVGTKKKGSKKDKDETKGEPAARPLKGSKVKGMGSGPSLTRGTSLSQSPQGQVAAAGQFGRRQNRGQFALPMSRAASDKLKIKTKSSKSGGNDAAPGSDKSGKTKKGSAPSAASASATVAPEVPKGPPVFAPPKPQSSFCGIKQSRTLFYPFLPLLPNEPSIKNRKQYPVMDRVNTTFMGFINSTSAAKKTVGGAPVNETEDVCQLMLETLKDLNPSGGQPTAEDDKKTAISNAVGSLRQTLSSMDKHQLAGDLFNTCSLLKRQHDFLQTNLSNMEKWCKGNFSEADYNATYGSPEKKQKEPVQESVLSTFKKPLIKVRVKCGGFKEPKLNGPLFAFLPVSVVPAPPGEATSSNKEKKTKKRKSATSEISILPASPTSVAPLAEKEVVIKTYAELRPSKRRQLITDHIAHTAKELEAACISRTIARCQAIDRRHSDLKKMVEEDEVLVIHTAAMWEYIEKAGYFADFTEEALNDTLRSVWAPDVTPAVSRNVPSGVHLAPGISRSEIESAGSGEAPSVFDKLQSLLVEEHSDDEEEEDEEDDDDDDSGSLLCDNIDEPIEASTLPTRFSGPTFANLIGLTLHERAYLHLCSAGFCENLRLPAMSQTPDVEKSLSPVTSDSSKLSNGVASEMDSSRGDESTTQEDGVSDEGITAEKDVFEEIDTLEDIVDRMSADLRELNKVNNARASFLESVARVRLATTRDSKKKSGDELALINRCQQLLKRSKDIKAKPSKPKVAAKDEYALPW